MSDYKVVELLKEITDKLENNDIFYFLSDKTTSFMETYGYLSEEMDATIYIKALDIEKFQKTFTDNEFRKLIVKYNGAAPTFYYLDLSTLYYNLKEGIKDNIGASSIKIVPLIPFYENDNESEKYLQMFRGISIPQGKAVFRKSFLIKVIAVLKHFTLFRKLVWAYFYKKLKNKNFDAVKFYYYYKDSKFVKIENLAIKGIRFNYNNKEYTFFTNQESTKLNIEKNTKVSHISSPYISLEEFVEMVGKQKLISISKKHTRNLYQKIVLAKNRKIRKEIILLSYLIADRFELEAEYRDKKQRILELWKSDDENDKKEFSELFEKYYKAADYYVDFDLGLCFDYDLLICLLDVILESGKYKKALRLVKGIPYQHFEDAKDYLKPYVECKDLSKFRIQQKNMSVYKEKKNELISEIKKAGKTSFFSITGKTYAKIKSGEVYNDNTKNPYTIKSDDLITNMENKVIIDFSLTKLNTEDAKKYMSLFQLYLKEKAIFFLLKQSLFDDLNMLDSDKEDIKLFNIFTTEPTDEEIKDSDTYVGNNKILLSKYKHTVDYSISEREKTINEIATQIK